MGNINIKFNEDFRKVFKAGQEINIPTNLFGITYLVGPNGCGKSTILRAIRSINDSMAKKLKHDFDGCRGNKVSSVAEAVEKGIIEISGLEKYTHIFAFDAEADDCCNVLNAASAYGFITGGGHAAQFTSRGQTAGVQFVKFISYFEECAKKAENAGEKFRPLVIIDEIDEGLDIRIQVKWNSILEYRFGAQLADILVVSHNPVCMLSKAYKSIAVDITTNKQVTPQEYIENLTGVTITMTHNETK